MLAERVSGVFPDNCIDEGAAEFHTSLAKEEQLYQYSQRSD